MNKNNKKCWWIVLILLFFLLGCDEIKKLGKNDTAQIQEEKKQVSLPSGLRVPSAELNINVDPGFGGVRIEDQQVVMQLFKGLLSLNDQGTGVVPALAERWTSNEDATVFTFFLRDDAKWSNGDPVTTADIVWAYHRNIDPKLNLNVSISLYYLKNGEKIHKGEIEDVSELGVKALNLKTVELTLENSMSSFPLLLPLTHFYPLPRKTIEKYGKDWTLPRNIVTNGPYLLHRWRKKNFIIMKKNPYYFEADRVQIPEIRFSLIGDSSFAMAMYKRGELDILGGKFFSDIPTSAHRDIANNKELKKQLVIHSTPGTEYIALNLDKKPLDNPLVRKALSAAIDREYLIKQILKNNAQPAGALTSPAVYDFSSEGKIGIEFDPKKAQQWLSQAGYPGGKGFPELIFSTLRESYKESYAIHLMLKQHLNIPIKMVAPKEGDDWGILQKESHLITGTWFADYPDPGSFLHDMSSYFNWYQGEFEEIIRTTLSNNDFFKRISLFRKAERILTEEEVYLIPLFYHSSGFLVNPRVEWKYSSFGPQRIDQWKLKN